MITIFFLVLIIFSSIPERLFYDPSLTSEYSCCDPKWSLQTNDSNWNITITIWTLTNVFIRPGVLSESYCPDCYHYRVYPWFFINASVAVPSQESNVTRYLDNMYESAMQCTKYIDTESNKREPVFFNFPCSDTPHWRWISSNWNLYSPPSSLNHYYRELPDGPSQTFNRDILIVFNSWSATSFYHVIIETIFPLWITVRKARLDLGYPINNMTIMNLSPTCNGWEPHVYTVKPVIETIFGSGTYEDTWGGLSYSFTGESIGYYKHMIYGFHYPLRPYRNHILSFNYELGLLFREFADMMKSKYINPNASCLFKDYSPNYYEIGLIYRIDYDKHRNFGNLTDFESMFLMPHNIVLNSIAYGKKSLSSIESQASISCTMNILMGAEGAGFVQQIFMPYNSLLIILHTPRSHKATHGVVEGSQWHEAVGQYLDHSVVNIITKGTDVFTIDDYQRVVNITMMAIRMHQQLSKQGKFFSCMVRPIDQVWQEANGCDYYYHEQPFLYHRMR